MTKTVIRGYYFNEIPLKVDVHIFKTIITNGYGVKNDDVSIMSMTTAINMMILMIIDGNGVRGDDVDDDTCRYNGDVVVLMGSLILVMTATPCKYKQTIEANITSYSIIHKSTTALLYDSLVVLPFE